MKTLLLLLTVFIINTIYSQTDSKDELKLIETDTVTVNPELPQYIVKVYTKDDNHWESTVKIYEIGDSTLFQTFFLDYGSLNTYEELMDINFDGYNDLEIVYSGNSQNTFSSFWLFNPNLKKFEDSKEYSDFGDITIDKTNQTISSWIASIGIYPAFSTSTYKVLDNHLVLIEDEYFHKFEYHKKVLEGDSLITVSRSYAESILEQHKNESELSPEVLWVVTEEEMVYGTLRPIKKTWQWEYEGEGPKELYEKRILRYSEFGLTFRLKQEVIYNYSMDDENNLFVDETVIEVVNGELIKKSNPKTLLKE